MRFLRRNKGWVALLLVVLAGYGLVRAATSETALRYMVDRIDDQLQEQLGLDLAIGHLDVDAGNAQLVATDVKVVDLDQITLFSARRIFVELSPLQFFVKRLDVDAIEIDDPTVHTRISKDGRILGIKPVTVPEGGGGDPLFRVDVGDFRVRNGTLQVDVEDVAKTTFSGIRSRLRSSGPDGHRMKFTVERGDIFRPGDDHIIVDRFAGRLTVFGDGLLAPERISLSEISLNSEESSVNVGGSILLGQLDLAPAFDVDVNATASLPAVLSHVEMPVAINGAVSVGAHVSAGFGFTDFQAVGQGDIAELEVEKFWVGTLRGQFHANQEELVVPAATWEYADTLLTGSGSVTLNDETLPFVADVNFDRFSLYKMLEHLQISGSWVEMLATGHVNGSGVLLPEFKFEGTGRGHFHDLVVMPHDARKNLGERSILEDPNDIDVDVTFLADMKHVHVAGIIDDQYTRADGHLNLWFDVDKGFEVVAVSERAGFGSLGGRIAMLDFTGDGYSTLTIRGPYTGPRIDADTTIRGFSLNGYDFGNMDGHISYDGGVLAFENLVGNIGSTKYTGSVILDWFKKMKLEKWHDAAGNRTPSRFVDYEGLRLDADIRIPRGMFQEIRQVIPGSVDPDGVLAFFRDLELEGPASGAVVAGGYIGDGTIEHIIADGSVSIGAGAKLLGQTLTGGGGTFSMPTKTVDIPGFVLEMGGGTVLADATIWRDDGALSGTLKAKGVSLSGIDALEGTDRQFVGTFDLDTKLSNFAQDPTLTGDFVMKDAAWGEIPIGNAQLSLVHASREITLKGMLLSGRGDGTIQVSTRSPFAYSASVNVSPGPARPLFPADMIPESLSINMGGLVDASGALSEFRSSRGTLSLSPLVVTVEDIPFSAAGDVLGHFRGSALTVDQLELASPRQDQVSLRGLVSSDAIDLQASGRGDLWLVPSFTKWVLSSSGPFSFDLAITGDFDDASMNGRGVISGGRFDVWKFDPILENVNAQLIFQGPNVIIDSLRARVGGAPAKATGSIQLAGFSPAAYDLVVDYTNLKLKIPQWLPTRSSGRLTVTGPAVFPTLAGEVELHQASYTETVNWERLLPDLRRKVSSPLVFDKAEEDIRLDLHIVADNGIVIDNNVVDLEAKGDLYLVGTEERPGLKGNVSLLRGNATFRNNRYQLTRGTVEFIDTYEISPVFDLEAETRVKDYDVTAQISGGLSELRIDFDSQPELAEIDIIALLTFGFTQFELRDATGTVGAGALEVVSAYSGLDEEVRRIVPQAVRDIDWLTMDELRLTSQFSTRQGTNIPAVAVGFEVNPGHPLLDGSHLRLQTTLFDDQGQQQQRVELEKRFDNNLRLRASWNSHDEALCQGCTTIGDPGVDLRYRFEY